MLAAADGSAEFVRELKKALPKSVAGALTFATATPAADDPAPWARALNSSTAVAVEHADPRTGGYLAEPGDAIWFIWCTDETAAESYDGRRGAVGILADSVVDFAWQVNRHLAGDLRGGTTPVGRVARGTVDHSPHVQERTSPPSRGPAPVGPAPESHTVPTRPGIGERRAPTPPARPFEPIPPPPLTALSSLLPRDGGTGPGAAAARSSPKERAPSPRPPTDRRPNRPRIWPPRGRRVRRERAQQREQAAERLIARGSTVILVGGRKGGGGKTMTAAAVALAAARALQPHRGTVIVIEQNITNPDVGSELGMTTRAPTVRRLVDALNRGAITPEPALVNGTPLHALPEARTTGDYSRSEVDRLCAHLRGRFNVIVVDLANTLPSIVAGPAGALFYYWLQHADVFVAPVGMDRNAWLAMAETLDHIEEVVDASDGRLQEPPAVVPILVSSGGEKAFDIPWFAEVRGRLADTGIAFVEIPHLVEVQTRSWHEARPPMDEVSAEAALASERLMLTIEEVVARREDA